MPARNGAMCIRSWTAAERLSLAPEFPLSALGAPFLVVCCLSSAARSWTKSCLLAKGGFHHLSNEFGLAADNVKNVEVITSWYQTVCAELTRVQIVLSNGTIVNANSGEHSDLFWALKGGGPNFGVATRFDLYTVPVHNAWAQLSVYAPQDAPGLIAAFDEWQRTRASDTKSSADLIISLDFAVLILAYSEPSAQPPAVFQPFLAVTPVQVALPPINLTFSQLCTILGSTSSHTPARYACIPFPW